MSEPADPGLSEEDLAILARLKQEVAERKAAGEWDTEPVEQPDKFDGPIGADNEGRIRTYATVEEARQAQADRARRQQGHD